MRTALRDHVLERLFPFGSIIANFGPPADVDPPVDSTAAETIQRRIIRRGLYEVESRPCDFIQHRVVAGILVQPNHEGPLAVHDQHPVSHLGVNIT